MNKRYLLAIGILLLTGLSEYAVAQLNPLGAQYYNNQYLANPAFAGHSEGLKLNGVYRKLWAGMPGSPTTQSITADYGFSKNGIGININNETAGLLKDTRALASYAYHIPFKKEGTRLSFGLSLGLLSQGVNRDEISGNPDDVAVEEENRSRNYFDGDFGAALTVGGLTLQAAVPNLKSFFKKDDIKVANVITFFSAASYQIDLNNGMELEPKVTYRGVKGFDNMLDVGTQFSLAEKKFMLMGMYHSNESATFGFGVDVKKRYLLSGMYTTQTAALGGQGNGSFEINLRVALGK
jgi:type IX secretion system PorP/SprF family membrane protein